MLEMWLTIPLKYAYYLQKPFNYQMLLVVDSFWLESIIYIFKVLVLDSDVVCFACFFFPFALVKSASIQEGESLIDACYISRKLVIALFATV